LGVHISARFKKMHHNVSIPIASCFGDGCVAALPQRNEKETSEEAKRDAEDKDS